MNTEPLYNELIKPKLIAEHSEAKVIPLSEIDTLIGAPLKLVVPQGDVTPTGISAIREYLIGRYAYAHVPPPESEESTFRWVWLDPKYGTLPKRIGKWLAKKSGRNTDPKVLSEVGNIARRNSDDNQAYYFRIVDKIDWSAEMFGKDGGGCWWGASGSSRSSGHPQPTSHAMRFIERGGLGVQFFKSEEYVYSNGIGRLWLLREPEEAQWAVCFNGYWNNEGATLRLSRVLATYLGLSYKKCHRLDNGQNDANRLYINDGHGYFVAAQQELSKLGTTAVLPRRVPRAPCNNCHQMFSLDGLTQERLCNSCWFDLSERCKSCAARKLKTQFKNLRGTKGLIRMCITCLPVFGYACPGCKTEYIAHRFKGARKLDGVYFCTTCTMTSRPCEDCGARTQNTDAMGDPLCVKCEAAFEDLIAIEHDYEEVSVVYGGLDGAFAEVAQAQQAFTFATENFGTALEAARTNVMRMNAPRQRRNRNDPPF